jgi:hypothetical protein
MLNSVCTGGQPSDQCSDTQAECSVSLKCLCKAGYFEHSSGGCTQSKLSFFTETIIYKVNICYSND